MATLTEVLAKVTDIENDIPEVQGKIDELQAEVARLIEIINNGGGVTAADLQGIADRLGAADAAFDDAVADDEPAPVPA